MTERPKHLTIPEAAAALGVCTWTVRRWIRDGKLAALSGGSGKGRTYLIPAEAVGRIAAGYAAPRVEP